MQLSPPSLISFYQKFVKLQSKIFICGIIYKQNRNQDQEIVCFNRKFYDTLLVIYLAPMKFTLVFTHHLHCPLAT